MWPAPPGTPISPRRCTDTLSENAAAFIFSRLLKYSESLPAQRLAASPDLVQAESTLIAAAGVLDLTAKNLERQRNLFKQSAGAQKDYEQTISGQQAARPLHLRAKPWAVPHAARPACSTSRRSVPGTGPPCQPRGWRRGARIAAWNGWTSQRRRHGAADCAAGAAAFEPQPGWRAPGSGAVLAAGKPRRSCGPSTCAKSSGCVSYGGRSWPLRLLGIETADMDEAAFPASPGRLCGHARAFRLKQQQKPGLGRLLAP